MSLPRDQEIACQQVLVDDSSVFSIQWSVFPATLAAPLTPEILLNRYLAYIRRCTATIIRPHCSASGIQFRLFTSRWSLISFLPPVKEQQAVVLRICGGMLVQPGQCERGELRFGVKELPDGIRVSLELSEYCPLLLGSPSPSTFRRLLYRLSQAAIHRLVTVRFLALLYRELAGPGARVRVVGVKVRDGQPV
ncbi:hypothetical protein F6V25_13325 [Oryzomonas japonica]|uniref:DUF1997 domain-containing protein n=1 Tax=Oryzomonas japonica TaxID=2603858 RepID=A0A7J4ZPH2_9BACT|nr:hypothetical protein [Oryzomonas japonica]KAB0664513.1 hypothetical protein F6V25_13325 [Oryzomonas japonica]